MSAFTAHLSAHRRTYGEILLGCVTVASLLQAIFDFRLTPPWRRESVALKVSMPDSGQLPMCATISGVGRAPKGKAIWLAHQEYEDSTFYFNPVQVDPDDGGHWRVRTQVGDAKGAHVRYVFQAILVDDAWGEWLTKVAQADGLGATQLPPHSDASTKLIVPRNGDKRSCA
ncbi:hypothetical protein [Actinomadura fibrosa]|uniref:Uncharacterized protein n=1 Tax=Actinomadura fibrosa TaxID=111802 RepID=A0ABW2XRA6_9ACTN|nr:hypothetical protein [Actinomadura fibrosa]